MKGVFTLLLFLLVAVPKSLAAVPPLSVPTSPYLIGTFFMPAWNLGTFGDFPPSWLSLEAFQNRKSLLGFYDDTNPEAMDWQIKWAREHGINFFIFDWFRCSDNLVLTPNCDTQLGHPIQTNKLPLAETLHQGFMRATLKNQMKFTIMLTTSYPWSKLYKDNADLRDNLMPYIITTYFKDPSYLLVDGKPVLYMFQPDKLDEQSGSMDLAKQAISIIRQKTIEAGFPGVIILGEDRSFTVRNLSGANDLKTMGFDYMFSYFTPTYYVNGTFGYQHNGPETILSQKQSYDYLLANTPIDFIGTASPFWDSFPLHYDSGPNIIKYTTSPTEYRQVLTNLKSTASKLATGKLGKTMLLVDAWNEYSEGHYVAPDVTNGFGYLQAIRATLTNANNTPDERPPLSIGFGPYDTLYKNYVANHERSYAEASRSAYTFNAKEQFIDVINPGFAIENTSTLTFGTWFKSDLTASPFYMPINMSQTLALLVFPDGKAQCVLATKNNTWYSPGTVAVMPSGSIKPNTWHQGVCVYNGSKVIAYLDGRRISTGTQTISGTIDKSLERLRLGYNLQYWNAASYKFFLFRNIAYTDGNVALLYDQTRPFIPIDTTPTPTRTMMLGDINGDSHVDIFDYNILLGDFGRTGSPGFIAADINHDGSVDIFDYNILLQNFGR